MPSCLLCSKGEERESRDTSYRLKFFCGLERKIVGKEISMSRKVFQCLLDLSLGGLLIGQRDVSEICRFNLRYLSVIPRQIEGIELIWPL